MIDIAIFSVMAAITDIAVALFGLLDVRFYLAISAAIIVLVYIRWRKYGFLINGFIMIVHVILFGIINGDWVVAGLHGISLIGMSVVFLLLQFKAFEVKGKFTFWQMASLFLVGYLVTFLMEWGLYNLLESTNFTNVLLNHIITFVVGLGLCAIIVHQENIAIDMDYYLRHKDKGKTT